MSGGALAHLASLVRALHLLRAAMCRFQPPLAFLPSGPPCACARLAPHAPERLCMQAWLNYCLILGPRSYLSTIECYTGVTCWPTSFHFTKALGASRWPIIPYQDTLDTSQRPQVPPHCLPGTSKIKKYSCSDASSRHACSACLFADIGDLLLL